jgi:hypothetical protein
VEGWTEAEIQHGSFGISRLPTKDDVAKYFPKIGKGKVWVTIATAISADLAMG